MRVCARAFVCVCTLCVVCVCVRTFVCVCMLCCVGVLFVFVCVRVRVYGRVCPCVRACLRKRVCVSAFFPGCLRVRLCALVVRASVCVCVCAFGCLCAPVCVCACEIRVRMRVRACVCGMCRVFVCARLRVCVDL